MSRRPAGFLSLFVLLLSLFICSRGYAQPADISLEALKKDLSDGNYRDLMKYHDDYLADLKQDGNSRHLGLFYNLLGHWDNVGWLKRWVTAEPNNFVAWTALGGACLDKGGQYRGQDTIDKVSQENLDTFHGYLNKTRSYLEYAVKLGPDDPYPFSGLMIVGEHMGWPRERLLGYFHQAYAIVPGCADIIWNMGVHYSPMWGGSAEEMRRFTEQYCLTAPKGAHLRLFLVRCDEDIWHSRGGRDSYWGNTPEWQECKQEFEDYLAVHPEDLSARSWYSFIAYYGRHFREAKEQFDVLGDHWNANSVHWLVKSGYLRARDDANRHVNDPNQGEF